MSRRTLLIKKRIEQKVVTGGMNKMGAHDGDSEFYAKHFKSRQTEFEKEYAKALAERRKK